MSSTPGAPRRPAGEEPEAALQGLVELVTYHDERTLYTVLKVTPEAGYSAPEDGRMFSDARLTAVGRTDEPVEGVRVRLVGRWTQHKTHGWQLEFQTLQTLPPLGKRGLVRYLASKTFEGIGRTTAERIVETLGEDALTIIRERPEELKQVTGLRKSVRDTLVETVQAQLALHETTSFLFEIGLGPVQARGVVKRLGPACEGLVRDDPYRIARVPGIGFATADRVAVSLGFEGDDARRVRAALLHTIDRASNDGHSLVRLGPLGGAIEELLALPVGKPVLDEALASLAREDALVLDRNVEPLAEEFAPELPCYLPWLHTSETGVARSLERLLNTPAAPLADGEALAKAEEAAGIALAPGQRDAVLLLLSHPVAVLTGGPGVGKTTIVRLVANLAEAAGAEVLLASPTGRAAKRMAEATGRPAKTIHRLLGFNADDDGNFKHNQDEPLKAGLVIIDEISMLDVALAHHLLKAVGAGTRLVLVGDPDQLPSVGAGNVLADLLNSRVIPTARLTEIFRQDANSLIVSNAHRVLEGDLPELPARGVRDADFYLFAEDDPARAADLLVDVVTQRIPRNFGLNWETDVQVIAPMYKGDCGVDNLNDRLREALGAGGREVQRGFQRWRVGDRVIHTRNDYEKQVFNGDMGRIRTVSPEGIVTVAYPEQDVVYESGELSDLRPAFAITVHRSQGGEFPCVVIPLAPQHRVMLQRNLFYTAITRARKLVVLVGSRRALRWAVETTDQARRDSLLAERLRKAPPSEQT